jgi:hypothetical protein
MRRSQPPKWRRIPGTAVTALAACLLLLVLLYVAWGQSGFPDETMMMQSGGSNTVAMAIQGAATRGGVGPLTKNLVLSKLRSKEGRNAFSSNKKKQNRLAIVLPFAGDGPESIPPYLSVFCVGAAAAVDTADFLIFHNGALESFDVAANCPSNVYFYNLGSTQAMAARLLSVLDDKPDSELAFSTRERLLHLTATHLQLYPYCLVEFKPALGHIFADYLQDYTHWGYSDLDILFGDLGRWITPDEWDEFDIVTYGFGDQERLYARGQFTFHKNLPRINQLWRSCEYLTNLDVRFSNIVKGKAKFRLESAEGCYSAAILSDDNIKVKFAVKAWTDIHSEDTAHSHGVFLASRPQTNKQVIYKAKSKEMGKEIIHLQPWWFEKNDKVYMDPMLPLQYSVGPRESIAKPDKDQKANCMYWVQEKYQSQLCLSETVTAQETVYWINGELYKQRLENSALDSGVVTAPFFHFQEWKRSFRSSQLTALHMTSEVSTFALTKEGAIPISKKNLGLVSSSKVIPSPLGLPVKEWKAVPNDDRSQLPSQSFCLLSGPRKFPPEPPARQCYYQVSWRDTERVEILSGAPGWKDIDVELDVTLVMTLQITESQATNNETLHGIMELMGENLGRWQVQPCVIVIHVAGATEASTAYLRQWFGPESALAFGIEHCLIAGVFRTEDEVMSRKALMNMAIDAVPTRWYTSGMELERGLSLSVDAAFFAHRAARLHNDFQGHVFFVPQFALTEANSDISVKDMVAARHKRKVKNLDEFEGLCDDDHPGERNEHANVEWWVQTYQLAGKVIPGSIKESVASLQELESRFLRLLTDEYHYAMFAMEDSPILLVDNLGVQNGIRTSEIAREIEEFGGPRCYNGLRLAQLAAFGYKFGVLAGAFAVSTQTSRSVVKMGVVETEPPQSSRCDGCLMFDEEHETILEAIVRDEIQRAANAAILWAELQEREQES